MTIRSAALVAAMVSVMGPQAFAQQAGKTISAELATIMVQEAVAKCRGDGHKISAKVVDAANLDKAFMRDEGAAGLTVDFVQAKINTVILTGRASGGPGGNPTIIKSAMPKTTVMGGVIGLDPATGKITAGVDAGGAVPIMIGADMVGAIGVSGAPQASADIVCANAGIAKVADKLK
jgi:uncharacterized protein GlcG (DUF336 family)